jgi:fatty-acyl-CoA synthase
MRANTPADDRAAAAPRRCARLYIDRLTHQLALLGGRACIRHDRKEIAAEEFLSSIYRYARALTALGIQRGQIVALFAPNRPDALAIRYAANLIGAGATFLSTPHTPEARSQLIAEVDPALLVVFPETQKFVPVGIETPMATVGFPTAGAVRLDEIAAPQAGNSISCLARPEDLAVVISSGGSTGVPKGSWRTFAAYTAMVTVPSPEDRRQLVNGHLAYLSQVLVDITLLGGGTVVLKDQYEAVDTLRTIETERITDLFLVEPQLFQLMDHPLVSKTDLSSLRTLTHIGASAPPVLRLRARQKLGPVIVHTYGASEEGLVSVLTTAENDPSDPVRFSSAGCILPGVEIRFRRADGSIASPGEIGGIEVRSPAMAQGYRNRPDLEAVAFREGWYRSGDLGRIDEDGYLHIFGRAVDIAVIDAAMISPTRLEDTLCRMPRIRYASVVRDNESADRWIAAVVPWDNVTVDETACLEAIAVSNGQMVAERIHVTVQSGVPLTEQGKPDREAIRALGRLNLNQAATSIKR